MQLLCATVATIGLGNGQQQTQGGAQGQNGPQQPSQANGQQDGQQNDRTDHLPFDEAQETVPGSYVLLYIEGIAAGPVFGHLCPQKHKRLTDSRIGICQTIKSRIDFGRMRGWIYDGLRMSTVVHDST